MPLARQVRTKSGRIHYVTFMTLEDRLISTYTPVETFIADMRDQAFMSQLEKMRNRGIPPAARLVAAEIEPLNVEYELSVPQPE